MLEWEIRISIWASILNVSRTTTWIVFFGKINFWKNKFKSVMINGYSFFVLSCDIWIVASIKIWLIQLNRWWIKFKIKIAVNLFKLITTTNFNVNWIIIYSTKLNITIYSTELIIFFYVIKQMSCMYEKVCLQNFLFLIYRPISFSHLITSHVTRLLPIIFLPFSYTYHFFKALIAL
jgi:hypothetical protein